MISQTLQTFLFFKKKLVKDNITKESMTPPLPTPAFIGIVVVLALAAVGTWTATGIISTRKIAQGF